LEFAHHSKKNFWGVRYCYIKHIPHKRRSQKKGGVVEEEQQEEE